MIPFMETLAVSGVEDVRPVLNSYKGKNIPKQFAFNMAQVQKQQREKLTNPTVSSSDGKSQSGWVGSIQGAVMSFFGLNRTQVVPYNIFFLF